MLKRFPENETICLDLSSSVPYKKKKAIIEYIASHGYKVSFIINKTTGLLVKDDRLETDSYKCRTAFKLAVPVVHVDYLYAYFDSSPSSRHHISTDPYLIKNKQDEIKFQNGVITGPSNFLKISIKIFIN